MQTINDGTHDILPAAVPIDRRPDCARVPVTMLRQSDGKVRRDGSSAAKVQPEHPVAERGGVQGASELQAREQKRVVEQNAVYYRSQKEKRRWQKEQRQHDRLGGQDKKPHIAAWAVGCFVCGFSDFLHIADHHRDVRMFIFVSDFSEYRTSRVQP
jgi:hypothetical protein